MLLVATALAFAPPLDTPLIYETVEHHQTPQGPRLFRMRERAEFARDGDGYRLTLRTVSYDTSAPTSQRDQFTAAMEEAGKVPVRLHLTHDGKPDRVIDAAATWAACVAAIRAVATGTPPLPLAAAYADKMAALPPAARDAQLLEDADAIVAPHVAAMRVGQIVADGDATLTREADVGGENRFRRASERPAPNGGRIAIEESFSIQPVTGLVLDKVRTVRVNAPGLAANVELSRSETRMVR